MHLRRAGADARRTPTWQKVPQVFCADLKDGEPVIDGSTWMATLTWLPLVLTFGSWKLVTPWVRIQAEKWYAEALQSPAIRSSWGSLPSSHPPAF